MPEQEKGSVWTGLTEKYRGLSALGAVFVIGLGSGVAVGSMGTRSDVQTLQQASRAMQADIATNRSNITAVQNLINDLDLRGLSENVSALRRELCLMRYDRAGTVGPAEQQECSALRE